MKSPNKPNQDQKPRETCEEWTTIWFVHSGTRKRCLVWLRKHQRKHEETCEELCASVCWTCRLRRRRRRKRRRRSNKNGRDPWVDNQPVCSLSSRKQTLTSECLDCHMQLWNKQRTFAPASSWRRSRVILIEKHFKPNLQQNNVYNPIQWQFESDDAWNGQR